MLSTKSLFFSALIAAMCASTSVVQAEEMTYGLKRQQSYGTTVTTTTTTTTAGSPDTANISPSRLVVMQRQKDTRGFSPYAARAGVNSINNPGAVAATTTTAITSTDPAAASPDTADISPQRQKDKRGFLPYAARAGVNSINNPGATASVPVPVAPVSVATTATVNTDPSTASAPVATGNVVNTNSDPVTSTDPTSPTANVKPFAPAVTTPEDAAPTQRVTTYLRA